MMLLNRVDGLLAILDYGDSLIYGWHGMGCGAVRCGSNDMTWQSKSIWWQAYDYDIIKSMSKEQTKQCKSGIRDDGRLDKIKLDLNCDDVQLMHVKHIISN